MSNHGEMRKTYVLDQKSIDIIADTIAAKIREKWPNIVVTKKPIADQERKQRKDRTKRSNVDFVVCDSPTVIQTQNHNRDEVEDKQQHPIKNDDVQTPDLHPSTPSLLDECKDVAPKEIPAILPSLQDVQHQIVPSPCSTLLDNTSTRMNYKDDEKTYQQIPSKPQSILDNCLIYANGLCVLKNETFQPGVSKPRVQAPNKDAQALTFTRKANMSFYQPRKDDTGESSTYVFDPGGIHELPEDDTQPSQPGENDTGVSAD